jgi:hypothetical protein
MSDFRFVAVQYLRAQTLTQITDLARRSYKGLSSDEREALLAIARAITREIISKRQEARGKVVHDETGKTNS